MIEFKCSIDGTFIKHILEKHISKHFRCLECDMNFENLDEFNAIHYNRKNILVCVARRLRGKEESEFNV